MFLTFSSMEEEKKVDQLIETESKKSITSLTHLCVWWKCDPLLFVWHGRAGLHYGMSTGQSRKADWIASAGSCWTEYVCLKGNNLHRFLVQGSSPTWGWGVFSLSVCMCVWTYSGVWVKGICRGNFSVARYGEYLCWCWTNIADSV